MSLKKTHYEILEVRDDASFEVIKMAYKALSLKYHPDTTKLDKQESYSHMQKVNAAYEVLSNSQKRLYYDTELRNIYGRTQSNWADVAAREAASAEARRRQEEAARAEARRRQAETRRRQEEATRAEARRRHEEEENAEARRKQKEAEARETDSENNTRNSAHRDHAHDQNSKTSKAPLFGTIKQLMTWSHSIVLITRDAIKKASRSKAISIPILIGIFILVTLGIGFKVYEGEEYKYNPAYSIEHAEIGGMVQYGYFEQDGNSLNGKEPIKWIVLNIDGQNNATLVSTKILHYKNFFTSNRSPITWDQTQIKYWLENAFASSLTSVEKEILVSYRIPNVTEAQELNQMGWKFDASEHASQQEADQSSLRKNCWWITPNSSGYYRNDIPIVNAYGYIDYDGIQKNEIAGIVPVIIVQLDEYKKQT